MSTASTGSKQITVSQTLTAGLYYIAGCWQGGTTSPTMRTYVNTSGDGTPVAGTSPASSTYYNAYIVEGITGAFATVTSPSPASSALARTQFRVA